MDKMYELTIKVNVVIEDNCGMSVLTRPFIMNLHEQIKQSYGIEKGLINLYEIRKINENADTGEQVLYRDYL